MTLARLCVEYNTDKVRIQAQSLKPWNMKHDRTKS